MNEAIEHAASSRWLENPQDQSQKIAQELDKKGKGALYIQCYLEQKGLPQVKTDPGKELEKALRVIEKIKKIGHSDASRSRSGEEPQQIASKLKNRGFEHEIIRKAINDTFCND